MTSHLTLLTSLHPTVHGVTADRALAPGLPTLAQLLRERGWVTMAMVDTVPWMAPRFGLDRGFDVYRRTRADAERRLPRLEALLDDLRHERFFLFLHFYDAHSDRGGLPYFCGPEDAAAFAGWYRGSFDGTDGAGLSGTGLLWQMNQEGETFVEPERRYVECLYDAGLRTLDRALGELFRGLERRELLQDTIVVLTADHGEEFQEHGRLLHGQAYEECLHVPLLFRLPEGGAPRAVDELVGLADVAPTLLELCGVEPPPGMQGRSLRPLLLGEDDPAERTHLLLMDEDGRLALRTSRWKLVTTPRGEELYDLVADPGETRDLLAEGDHDDVAAGLRRLLEFEQERAASLRAAAGGSVAPAVELGDAERQALRELRYAAGE